MAPRTSWKGFIKLSLVSVPVKAYTANNTSEEIRLNQLHKECNSRIKYQKICPEHGVVKSDEIVSGYEYSKDEYVIIESEEIQKIRKQSDRAVGILGFVGEDEIPDVYHAGRTYYLAPDGVVGTRPFALLHKGMLDGGVCALAQIVMSGREQLVLLKPADTLLTMTILNHKKKVKPITDFTDLIEEGDMNLTDDEVTLAETLIKASTIKEFDYSKYDDEYVAQLKKVIQMKVDGQEIVQAPDREEPKILNLMDALKQSVAAAQAAGEKKMAGSERSSKGSGKKKASKKKAAPSVKPRGAAKKKASPRKKAQ